MYLITFFILSTFGEILQSTLNQNTSIFPTKVEQCQSVELKENENFYLEMNKEGNIFYRFSNDFQELGSNKWNLTFVDFISSVEIAPDYFSILQSQQLLFPGGMSLCSLLQNQRNLDYSISCKDIMQQQYFKNYANFSQLYEFSFLIVYQKGLKCYNFIFFNQLFYILCTIEDQMQLISFDQEGNKQQFNSNQPKIQSCNIKFQSFQTYYLLVSFYSCINWELLLFDQHLQCIKSITDQEIYLITQSNSNKHLQDILLCQESLYFIFDQDYFSLNILYLLSSQNEIYSNVYYFEIEKLKLLELLSCTKDNQEISRSNFEAMFTDSQLENIKIILKLGPYITFMVYSDQLIVMLTKGITQTIQIEIQFFCQVQTNTKNFWIVDKQNTVNIFEINLFQNYFTYQSNSNYVGFYTIDEMNVMLLKCFAITQYINRQDIFKSQIENLKYQNYVIQIDDNFDNIQIEKSKFFLNKNFLFHFTFPNLFQQRIEQKEINRQCNINKKQLNLLSKFLIFRSKSQNYFMFNNNELLTIYNCDSQRYSNYNIKIDLNSIKTYYSIQDVQFIFVQETEGRIIAFQLFQSSKNSLQYQIYQFNEQIRISFTYKNLLIVQLQDSKQLYFQNSERFTFQNQSYFKPYYFFNEESIKEAIKIFNFYDMFIFQHESYFIVQVDQFVTQKIYLNIVILGGYSRRSPSPQVILIGINQNMSRIDKYLITKRNYYQLSTYYFEDYFPIQPLNYQIHEENFIITTRQQNNNQFHLMLFIINQVNSFECHEIISTPYQYFYAISNTLYYYNENKELIEYDMKYLSFYFGLKDLNQIYYNLKFQIDITVIQSPRNENFYSEELNLLVLNMQEKLSLVNQSNTTIILNNNLAILYPNQFVRGIIFSFDLSNTSSFSLQNPFKLVQEKKCISLDDSLCIIKSDQQIKVYDLITNIESNYSFSIILTENTKFHSCEDGIIIIEQIEYGEIKIIYFTKDTQKVIQLEGPLLSSYLRQQILIIEATPFTYFYFLDGEIRLLSSIKIKLNLSRNFIFYQIDTDKICQILIETDEIHILCFQINQGVTLSLSNYTVPIQDIYNATPLTSYLPEFASIQIINLTCTLQNVIDLKIAVNYKRQQFQYQQILLFYVEITLKNQEYQINLNYLIRLPKFNANCRPFLIQNYLLYSCNSQNIFLFQLQNEFQVLDPYAIYQLSGKTVSLLNNTHIAIFNQNNNQVSIFQIDFWRLIKNENINVEDELNVTFIASNQINMLEFKVNVVNQRNLENFLSNIRVGIIVINVVFIQIFVLIKKQKKA